MTDDKLADMLERSEQYGYDVGSELDLEQWQQIIAALRRSEPDRNQCDGCARNLQLGKDGIHYELDGKPVMVCTAHLYERQPSSDKVLVPRDKLLRAIEFMQFAEDIPLQERNARELREELEALATAEAEEGKT